MKHFCISKFKNSEHFQETFNSFNDIGDNISIDSYLHIEDKYLEVLFNIINKLNNKNFYLKNLSDFRANREDIRFHKLSEPFIKLCGGQAVNSNELELLIRMSLRNLLWVRLETDSGDYICFGDDLHSYIGLSSSNSLDISAVLTDGIYADECEVDMWG